MWGTLDLFKWQEKVRGGWAKKNVFLKFLVQIGRIYVEFGLVALASYVYLVVGVLGHVFNGERQLFATLLVIIMNKS